MEEAAGGGGGGGFSGIDPQRLHGMISSLGSASKTLHDAKGLKGRFAEYGVDTSALNQIESIAAWVDDQMPGLKRRCTLSSALDDGPSAGTFVYVLEPPPMSAEQARNKGRELAKKLSDIRTDGSGADAIHEVAQELARHRNDPDYLSAFYAQLEAQHELQILAPLIAATGSDTARADLQVISETFGTAVSAPYPAPGFDAVKKSFTEPPPEGGTAMAWNRGALLAYGDFPADWLAKVARANVLDSLAADQNQDFRGGNVFEMQAFGLPDSTVALFLHALGNNGAAARDALTNMGGADHRRSLPENFKLFLDLAKSRGTGDEIADAFGEAMEAGAGVHDETMGHHSRPASLFAFNVITSMADYEQNDGGVPWRMKDSMGEVAASYAPEIVTGSVYDDQGYRDSSMQPPTYWTSIPGLDPAFYLGNKDTYAFLKTFANSDQLSHPFDEAMGRLQNQLLVECAKADAADLRAGRTPDEHFQDALAAFGNTAGFEYQAQLKVRGDMDEFDKKCREVMGYVLTLGFDKATPINPASIPASLAWKVTQYGVHKGISYLEGGPQPTRVDQVEASHDQMVLASRYQMASTLMEADWPVTEPPPDSIMEGDHLKPLGEIAKDEDTIRAFQNWMDSNNQGGHSFDQEGDHAANVFVGANGRAQTAAEKWEGGDDGGGGFWDWLPWS